MMKGITATGTILDKIVARKIEEVADLPAPGSFTSTIPDPPRGFTEALRKDTIGLIAEVKHASPSKGILVENFDPVAHNRAAWDREVERITSGPGRPGRRSSPGRVPGTGRSS